MAIKRPLVRSEGHELLEDLPISDTISTEIITDSTDKRFVTDAEKLLINSPGPNSDWNSTSGESKILNKPDLSLLKYDNTTGIIQGGRLSKNLGDGTLLDIDAGKSLYINFSNPENPVAEILSWDATTVNPSLSAITSRLWVGIQRVSPGVSTFVYSEEFTPLQRRTIAVLGRVWGSGTSNIDGVGQYSTPSFNGYNTLIDLISILGSINKDGNIFYPNGINLRLDKTSGHSFRFSANFLNEPTSPNIQTDPSMVNISSYNYHMFGATSTTIKTTIDPNNYDVSGVLTQVPVNKFTIQRVYYFPKSQVVDVVYGQTLYGSIDAAAAALATDPINIDAINVKLLEGSILRSLIIVKGGATDLSNIADCKVFGVSNFGAGASSSGIAGITVHSELSNLDYASSGHTGFLSTSTTQDDIADGTNFKQFSTSEKTKLAGIESGANVNVQADWNALSGDAYIKNKPIIPETLVSVSGSNKYVQYNRNGNLSSDINFTWDYDTQSLNIGQATILPDNPLAVSGSSDSYLQLNLQNSSTLGSSDFVITSNDGNDTERYGDIGFCNSGYTSIEWDLFTAYDMYMFSDGGDLVLGSTTPGKSIRFFIANTLHEAHPTDIIMQIDENGVNLPSGGNYKINGVPIGGNGGLTEDQIKELVYAQVLMYGG